MNMKVVICEGECSLSIEKGDSPDEIRLSLYGKKDANMDGKPDGQTIVVKRSDLDKAINFILDNVEPEPAPKPPMPPLPAIT